MQMPRDEQPPALRVDRRKPPKDRRKEVCIPEAKISRSYASRDPKPRCPHEYGHGTLGACATSGNDACCDQRPRWPSFI
jgi:hypothetical protein